MSHLLLCWYCLRHAHGWNSRFSLFCAACFVLEAVRDGQRLREVVQGTIVSRPLNELRRLFSYSELVAEMLEPFILACANALFLKMCSERCKVIRGEDSISPSMQLVLTLDQITTRVSAAFPFW